MNTQVEIPEEAGVKFVEVSLDGAEDQNYSRGGRPIRVVNDGSVIKELFA